MDEALKKIAAEALKEIGETGTLISLDAVRVRFLGKKGRLTQQLRGLGRLSNEERRVYGAMANRIKQDFHRVYEERLDFLKQQDLERRLQEESLDVTLPGRARTLGALHPVTRVLKEISAVFNRMGFQTATGPEVEDERHNFEALNIPANHPAREMHDTFYLPGRSDGGRQLLRTHTSPVQIRVMESAPPPFRVIAPGKVFRCDSDLTHTPMFHQTEGFMVDKEVHFGQLKGVMEHFLEQFFERDALPIRFRPSFFPFTEPSAEVDIGCFFCDGAGCRVCKGNGWLEVLGCGMIHPAVLNHVHIDPEIYTGFAFGMGVERLAMLKYNIGDLRTFFENDVRFLTQVNHPTRT